MIVYKPTVIDNFSGENRWLSNFAIGEVTIDGLTFLNREAAFQAMKTVNPHKRKLFTTMNPSEAKKAGRMVELRPDWEEIKEKVMYDVCKAFFSQHLNEREKLIETGFFTKLIERNHWHDNFWGVCTCQKCQSSRGKNRLGKILMAIRTEFIIEDGSQNDT